MPTSGSACLTANRLLHSGPKRADTEPCGAPLRWAPGQGRPWALLHQSHKDSDAFHPSPFPWPLYLLVFSTCRGCTPTLRPQGEAPIIQGGRNSGRKDKTLINGLFPISFSQTEWLNVITEMVTRGLLLHCKTLSDNHFIFKSSLPNRLEVTLQPSLLLWDGVIWWTIRWGRVFAQGHQLK